MLNKDYTSKILNLEDVKINNVENESDSIHIYLELPRKEHICPACGATTNLVHDYREQVVKDVPLGRTTYLHLRKRRYRCPACGKRFAEANGFLPRYHRMTNRLVASIINAFRKVTSATEIAAQHNVSVSSALRCFDLVSYRPKKLSAVLSIDEFKGNAGHQKYQAILTNPEKKEILDILPNRYESDLISYFRQFPLRKEGKERLQLWFEHLHTVDLPEFDDCEKACRNWFQEILNSFDVPWTNGFTEGCNNKTKVLKRVYYGVRNFNRFRNRILHCSS
ncbi:MAG: transposase [Oscillospiraceae bacterium]|nr:transposase [Oscillospiraceae bacterium]